MGILDALSGGLTTATNAATAQQTGQIQGGQLAAAFAMRQAQIAKDRADTEQALAHSALFRHQNEAPVLGQPGYNEAKGGEAGAVADAQVGPHVRQAVETAQGEDPIKRDFAAYQNSLALTREKELENLKATLAPKYEPFQAVDSTGNPVAVPFNKRSGNFGAPAQGIQPLSGVKMAEGMANDFARQNQDLIKPISKYISAKNAFAQARAGNPAAAKASMINYVANADPNMQLRQGVMQYATRIHPGAVQNFEQALGLLLNDKADPKDIAYMEQLVDRLHSAQSAAYELRRAQFVRGRPMAESLVPHANDLYDAQSSDTPPAPGIGGFSRFPRKP